MTTRSLAFVDGLDGSGKSTLAKRLHAQLERSYQNPVLISVDDFRQAIDWQGLQADDKAFEATAYYQQYFDLAALDAVLGLILAGAEAVKIPVFCENQSTTYRSLTIPSQALVLVEGVFTQRLASAKRGALVYVDCPWTEARRRILHRDQARGRSAAEVQHRIDSRYFPAQEIYHEAYAPVQHADWVVNHETQGAARLARWPTPLCAAGLTAPQAEALHEALLTL